MKKIYFRADAGADIGYGHFIRSLSLASILKDKFECALFTQTPSAYQLKEAEGVCPLVSLPSTQEKYTLFLDRLDGDEIVVLDNYFHDVQYQKAIKEKGCSLVCIDDRKGQQFYTDVIINHVIGISESDMITLKPARLLLGTDYALLRKCFMWAMRQPAIYNPESEEVLVAMGGTDYNNMSVKIVRLLLQSTDFQVNVLLGDSYKYETEIATMPVRIYKNCSAEDLKTLIQKQKLVISTPSTLAYEVCAVGCLLMVGSFAENHIDVEKNLAKYHLATACGRFSELTSDVFCDFLKQTFQEKEQIRNQRHFFDGKQAERFLACFENFV